MVERVAASDFLARSLEVLSGSAAPGLSVHRFVPGLPGYVVLYGNELCRLRVPGLPCQLVSGWALPMESPGKRSISWSKREAGFCSLILNHRVPHPAAAAACILWLQLWPDHWIHGSSFFRVNLTPELRKESVFAFCFVSGVPSIPRAHSLEGRGCPAHANL